MWIGYEKNIDRSSCLSEYYVGGRRGYGHWPLGYRGQSLWILWKSVWVLRYQWVWYAHAASIALQIRTGYCVQWYPQRWVPVQVMIPGRWVYRPVWIPARAVTLYQYVPGYWHRTNLYGTPDVRVMRTPNGWQAMPYQAQAGDGSFNAQGVWQPAREK